MSNIEFLRSIKIEELLRIDLDKVSFMEVEKQVANIIFTLSLLLEKDPDDLPPNVRQQCEGYAEQLEQTSKQIIELDIANTGFHPARAEFLTRLRDLWNNVSQYYSLAVAIDSRKKVPSGKELNNKVKKLNELIKTIEDSALKAEAGLQVIQEAAGKGGVSQLHKKFSDEVKEQGAQAGKWLNGLIVGIIVLVIIGGWFSYTLLNDPNMITIESSILRIGILAALYGIIHVFWKTYLSFKHLETINRHRVNIAETYDLFLEAQPTPEAKQVMAAIASEHLLAFGKSGLISKDLSTTNPSSLATGLIKSIIGKQE